MKRRRLSFYIPKTAGIRALLAISAMCLMIACKLVAMQQAAQSTHALNLAEEEVGSLSSHLNK